jgi:hypothetical protein
MPDDAGSQGKACDMNEIDALRAFAQEIMKCWPMGDLDGGTLQEAAVRHGLLRPETRYEPCLDDGCTCAEYFDEAEFAGGVTCYRKTALLTANEASSLHEIE